MDHNKLNQSIPVLDDGKFAEIIDHHRLCCRKANHHGHRTTYINVHSCLTVSTEKRRNSSGPSLRNHEKVVPKLAQISGIKSLKECGQTMFSGVASLNFYDQE